MTLEEAITHAKEVAEEKRKDYERACALNIPSEGCYKCANEHEQLATWLEELEVYKKAYNLLSKAYCDKGECWSVCECYEQCKKSGKKGVDVTKELYLQKAREDDENSNIP